MKRIVAMVFAVVSICAPALADFAAGQLAMENGDHVAALKEFLPLASEGDAGAQTAVGFLYQYGQGIPQDYRKAVKWYRLAAEQGDALAQTHLGLAYEQGYIGFVQDYKGAAKWYRLAAEQGDALGQLLLGNMYERGLGVSRDYVEAHMWFNLAGAGGEAKGGEFRDYVARNMTPSQMAEAQRRAHEWTPKTAGRVPGFRPTAGL